MWPLLDSRFGVSHSCLVSGAAFYPQASLDTFSMDLFLDEKLYRWVQKMISMLIEICRFVLSDSITSPLIGEL